MIGVGRIGRMHAELLAHQVPGAALGAVYDAYEPAARGVAAELGVPAAASVEEIFDADLDAVAICSSSDTHVDLLIAAAQAGKAVFCEKPVSLDLAEVDRALGAIDAAGVPFQIGFNRRFDPAHASVRDAVASGAVGDPHLVRISSRDPEPPPLEYVKTSGGLFLDMMIHDFDMARFVTGSEVVEVFARGAVRVEPSFARGRRHRHRAGDARARGRLPDRDRQLPPRRLRLRPASRGVRLGRDGGVREPARAHRDVLTAAGERRPPIPHFFLERYLPSYVREWEAFVEARQARDGARRCRQPTRAPRW